MRAFLVTIPVFMPDRYDGTATEIGDEVRDLAPTLDSLPFFRDSDAQFDAGAVEVREVPDLKPSAPLAAPRPACPRCGCPVIVRCGRILPHLVLGFSCAGGGMARP